VSERCLSFLYLFSFLLFVFLYLSSTDRSQPFRLLFPFNPNTRGFEIPPLISFPRRPFSYRFDSSFPPYFSPPLNVYLRQFSWLLDFLIDFGPSSFTVCRKQMLRSLPCSPPHLRFFCSCGRFLYDLISVQPLFLG